MKKLRASVEEVYRHAELLRTNVLTYRDRFKTYLREGFAAFLAQLQSSTKELLKSRDLGFKKSADVNFAIVDEMLSALKPHLSHLGQSLNSGDYK